jgi:hypothetical protein
MQHNGKATALTIALTALLAACGEVAPAAELPLGQPGAAAARRAVPNQAVMVEVTASHRGDEHLFSLSAREVPQGWTTFRFANASHTDHFVLLFRAPQEAIDAAAAAEQTLLEHWHENVTVPFQRAFNPYVAGVVGYEAFIEDLVGTIGESAPWFLNPGAQPMGGPGLTAAGHTSQTTVLLEPGLYVLECYVKDENEEFHSYNGMLDLLAVTEDASGAREPTSTVTMSLSSTGGIALTDDLRPGLQTIAIQFQDQATYEHLQGHNAHLVRLDGTDTGLLDALAAWMDWRQPGSLAFRAPRGATFLGGTMEMPAGATAYYTVNLVPGEYAWIAEVPDPAGKNMLKTFSVPSQRASNR